MSSRPQRATEGITLVAQSWGRRNVREGGETHLASVPRRYCSLADALLREGCAPSRGPGKRSREVILEEYEKLLRPRARIVAFSQVSNALGTITPARERVEIAHRYGACADGAQAVSHMSVDAQALDCDFYMFSGHKVLRPRESV